MSYRIRVPESSETPIERIFQRVMRRKMTPEEKLWFHLKPVKAHDPEKSRNGASSKLKDHAKLTGQ
jgi:hypothetical protein